MLQSPFRYPGGKNEFAPLIEQFILENNLTGRPYIEPFAGGAAVGLHLLSKKIVKSITLIEHDPLMASFWMATTMYPAELCKAIWDLEISLATWHKFQAYLRPDAGTKYKPMELALAAIFFNRCNFSGILHAGPIGGLTQGSAYSIDCRFNKDRITAAICDIAKYRSKIEVIEDDACNYLITHKRSLEKSGAVIYADPPYFDKGKRLYRYHFDDEDHEAFADAITDLTNPWLVSYDNSEFIAELFEDFTCTNFGKRYSAKTSRSEGELLATNYSLPGICKQNQLTHC